jgi:hypothetical protein
VAVQIQCYGEVYSVYRRSASVERKLPNGLDLTRIRGDSLFAIVGEIVAVRYLRVNEFVSGQISRSLNY